MVVGRGGDTGLWSRSLWSSDFDEFIAVFSFPIAPQIPPLETLSYYSCAQIIQSC